MPKPRLKSATMIGGASPNHKRAESDFYPTPPECTVGLMRAFRNTLAGKVWEPACGDGAISEVLIEMGRDVYSTDLRTDSGYGAGGIDALTHKPLTRVDCIITNPPFSLAVDFIKRLRPMGVPFALLLKSTFWHAKTRSGLFYETRPTAVCPMLWRPNFAPDRGKSPTMDVCWVVWDAQPTDCCVYMPIKKPK